MASVFSGSISGNFISTGAPVFIPTPEGFDYMIVENTSITQTSTYPAATVATGFGARFDFWPATDNQGQGTVEVQVLGGAGILVPYEIAAGAGFLLQNTTINNPSTSVALTGITGGLPPVVNTASTAGLINGSVVRIFSTVGAQQLAGIDFSIGNVIANTSFTLANMIAIANANPGAGTYRIIPYDPYIYPPTRTITNITPGPNAAVALSPNLTVITLSVKHNFHVGQQVRLIVPPVTAAAFGMTALNGMQVTIVNIGDQALAGITNTITVNVNSTAYGAWAWPLTTDPSFTPAQVVPIGEQTAIANINPYYPANSGISPYLDAWDDIGQIGVLLMAGPQSPAGQAGNVINWIAFKSFNT